MKLTADQEEKLRKCLKSGTYSTRELAAKFGVTPNEMYEYCAVIFNSEGLCVSTDEELKAAQSGGRTSRRGRPRKEKGE